MLFDLRFWCLILRDFLTKSSHLNGIFAVYITIMGGQDGNRGYLLQAIIAVIQSLTNTDWVDI